MPAPIRRTDELGFHVPATFAEAPEAGSAVGRAVRRWLWRWRWVLLVLLLPLLFYDKLLAIGGHWIAERMLRQAEVNYVADDLPSALADLDRAIYWEPEPLERCQAYLFRGQVHEKMRSLEKSEADFGAVIELLSDPGRVREEALDLGTVYDQRAWIRQRLGRHREALDDATTALKFVDSTQRPQALNQRAYIRALAGMELEQGLEDIEQALAAAHHDDPEFIDTRGYLRLRLGKFQDALSDFDNAILGWEQSRPRLGGDGTELDRWVYVQRLRDYTRNLAVMRHHRGEAYEKLGKSKEAKQDFEWAEQHGYNPADGNM